MIIPTMSTVLTVPMLACLFYWLMLYPNALLPLPSFAGLLGYDTDTEFAAGKPPLEVHGHSLSISALSVSLYRKPSYLLHHFVSQ